MKELREEERKRTKLMSNNLEAFTKFLGNSKVSDRYNSVGDQRSVDEINPRDSSQLS